MTPVRIERPARDVARLVLDDPAKRNALSAELRNALLAAADTVLSDDAVRAVVLTGAGGVFCAGGDLSTMGGMTVETGRARMKAGHRLVRLLAGAEKPIIAAIEGPAMGGGAGLALLADIVVMGAGAVVGFPYFKVGLVPDYGLFHTLPRRVGVAQARRLFVTAATVRSGEALAMGLADRVVPDGEVQAAALAEAAALAAMPAHAFALTKQQLAQMPASLDAALEMEALAQAIAFGTADHAEGRAAFFGKRRAVFRSDDGAER
ncbi:MAG: enoyl-CoA hydratase/isomerase family protein [Alphaproteobacteria bacterium]|nr:enoyl-CoA hydratase/isomerase family protein [Alphaproteobacteria bacterium]